MPAKKHRRLDHIEALLIEAQRALGKDDEIAACAAWQKVIDEDPGSLDGQFAAAMKALHTPDMHEKGQKWLRAVADDGHEVAMFELGLMAFEEGQRLVDDPKTPINAGAEWMEYAVHWWNQAAEAGSLPAAYNLGYLRYEVGDWEGARRWWQQAADAGYIPAWSNLAALAAGEGAMATAKAMWLQVAEALPDHAALYNLGLLCELDNDRDGALHYFTLAATAGDDRARAKIAADEEKLRRDRMPRRDDGDNREE